MIQVGGPAGPAPIQPGGEPRKPESIAGSPAAAHLNPNYGVEGEASTSESPLHQTAAEKQNIAKTLQQIMRGVLDDE